jgi:putative endonuclease
LTPHNDEGLGIKTFQREANTLEKGGYVYIMTNHNHTVLYVGVTSNLVGRVFQHREKIVKGFTSRYNLTKLVWYEKHFEIINAIVREKQIKAGSRARKVELVNAMNPEWNDLYSSIIC